ncbi:hypothetical protein [uncultured Traorella sp.]|uniref:hypothetical protein n=1 Tax=uncultured Traorella sp. TaxID=1929048 RepID=UPI0025D45338|nr:hypothetical protein [uncultured Traorella sp.]
MKDMIAYKNHTEYVHLHCCYQNLYDVLLRVDFLDFMERMKRHPMTHELTWVQRITFFFHRLHYFIFEADLEILREAFDSLRMAYQELKKLEADEEMLADYAWILEKMKQMMIDRGHLD